ncbi:MAG: AAA family ATPase, partial [Slackia sp.]|nr:AAA family ATPase [Slackia sp.]
MHLKSLVLKGFKSFADRTVISLEPGITAIVGPNGSGKSNISDAVLWVLGERNAKNLRGQAMEDVIFSGSTTRRGVGAAQVDLVLDNADMTLPVDFSEVSLTRRMYRSGESEYLINGVSARRMDFMDILHDTGLGADSHSIIGQGNIDAVLAGRPQDRLALIEEAAGVLKHKQRKQRSQRKLAAMDAHLARVKDIAAEVERQLKPLARKARRAEEYRVVSDELAEKELSLAVDDLRLLQKRHDAASLRESEAFAAIEAAKGRLDEAEAQVRDLQERLRRATSQESEAAACIARLRVACERFESSDMLLAEKARSMGERIDASQETLSSCARRVERFEAEAAVLQEKLAAAIARRDAAAGDLDAQRGERDAARGRRKALDERLSEVRALVCDAQRRIDAATKERDTL